MPRSDYTTCRICKRSSDECGELSHTRLCEDCGTARLAENVLGLHEHHGPALKRWRRAMATSIGAVLVEDLHEKV